MAINVKGAPESLKNIRENIRSLAEGSMKVAELESLIKELDKCQRLKLQLKNLLQFILTTYMKQSKLYGDGTTEYADQSIPKGVSKFLKCIASVSPVCSYLPPTESNLWLAQDLLDDIKKEHNKVQSLEAQYSAFRPLKGNS